MSTEKSTEVWRRETRQARRHLEKAKSLEDEAAHQRDLARRIFGKLGYCDCRYSFYKVDDNGNCIGCGKRSRSILV